MPSASETAAIQTLLTSVAQALPTNQAQALTAAGAVALPTTPASPLQVQAPQPLAVVAAGYKPPVQPPFYKRPVTWATAGIGLIGLLGIVYLARRKPGKRR